jgi:hypothetical protein
VVIQSWQRVPTTLLSEYCQREKRARPIYRDLPNRGEDGKPSSSNFLFRIDVAIVGSVSLHSRGVSVPPSPSFVWHPRREGAGDPPRPQGSTRA